MSDFIRGLKKSDKDVMQYRFFKIPVNFSEPSEKALNAFVSQHQVSNIVREFVSNGDDSFWAVCIAWHEHKHKQGLYDSSVRGKSKIDYKEVLSPDEFTIYAKLRDLRTTLASETGKPVYAIFNNEQLAGMVRQATKTKADLLKIDGIGESKVEQYGEAFLNLLNK